MRFIDVVLFRELAFQIADQFAVLGAPLNVRSTVIVGGMDMMTQAIELERRPHVVVATPGRMVDHLRSTSGDWSLRRVQFLVCPSYAFRCPLLYAFLTGTRRGRPAPHTNILVRPCGAIPCPTGAAPDLTVHRYHNQFDRCYRGCTTKTRKGKTFHT